MTPAAKPSHRGDQRGKMIWLLICTLCAGSGYALGHARATRPASTAETAATQTAAARATVPTAARRVSAPSGVALDNAVIASPSAPADDRRRALIEILQRLGQSVRQENFSDMFRLITWTQVATEDELAEALALGAEIEPNKSSPVGELVPMFVLSRWAAIDGPAALAAYLELDPEQRSEQAGQALFKTWIAEGDPQDALDHALACRRAAPDESGLKPHVLRDILTGWDQRDPDAALAAARQLAASAEAEERTAAGQLATQVVRRLAESGDTAATLDWIDQWPDAAMRDTLRLNLISRPGQTTADAAEIGTIIARMESTDAVADNQALRRQATKLAEEDVYSAQRWATSLPAPARSATAGVIASQLADKGDWRAAASWVDNQITDPEGRAQGYGEAADAAARQGHLAAALDLHARAAGTGQTPDAERQADLLSAWLSADPRRAELLLPHALAAQPE